MVKKKTKTRTKTNRKTIAITWGKQLKTLVHTPANTLEL